MTPISLPGLLAAEDKGVTVRWLDFHPEDCTLALETLSDLLNEKNTLAGDHVCFQCGGHDI